MSIKNKFKALDEIYAELEKLKLIFSQPRIWLTNYFSDMKTIVDIGYTKYQMNPTPEKGHDPDVNNELDFEKDKAQVLKKSSEDKREGLLKRACKRYDKIIEKLEKMEKNCLEKLPTDKLDDDIVDRTERSIEDIESRILGVEANNNKDANADVDINYIDWLIHETCLQLQKHIMLNRGLIFVSKDTLILNDLNVGSFGTLLIITDEFFSQKAIDTIQ